VVAALVLYALMVDGRSAPREARVESDPVAVALVAPAPERDERIGMAEREASAPRVHAVAGAAVTLDAGARGVGAAGQFSRGPDGGGDGGSNGGGGSSGGNGGGDGGNDGGDAGGDGGGNGGGGGDAGGGGKGGADGRKGGRDGGDGGNNGGGDDRGKGGGRGGGTRPAAPPPAPTTVMPTPIPVPVGQRGHDEGADGEEEPGPERTAWEPQGDEG
jgi:hypothetical protein